MKYFNPVSKSEAKYSIDSIEGSIEKGGGAQGSYNLKSEIFDALKTHGVLMEDGSFQYDRKDRDGNAYVLSTEYTLQLGEGVLWLIGDEYAKKDNKFIASINGSNGKFQMYRTVYSKLVKENYEWFVKLYDKNLTGNNLVFDIDCQNKILKFDIGFNAVKKEVCSKDFFEVDEVQQDSINNPINYPHNRIIFGAPGTGKSHQIDKYIEDNNLKDLCERVTVHPNYTYSQFVGSYKPVSKKVINNSSEEEIVSYEFVPGPFLRVLIRALSDSEKPYVLVVEEINRANPAAIFGDIFQLLDRDSEGKSAYTINISEEMKKYFKRMEKKLKKTLLIEDSQIAIPSNMYIWATMNSADQGVYPMDSAFKRRWSFEYIGINDNEQALSGKDYEYIELKNTTGGYTRYAWNTVRKTINEKLRGIVQEDKLLGPFFLSKKELRLKGEQFDKIFKSKVLMYLFEDVLKHKKCDFFTEGVKTLSDVMNYYDQGKVFNFSFEVASDEQESDKEVTTQGEE